MNPDDIRRVAFNYETENVTKYEAVCIQTSAERIKI
jgi:hypothetical protein